MLLVGFATTAFGGHHGCGGPHFSFGLNFAPAPYYYHYPVYAYPAYGYPYPYAYPYPAYYAAPAPAPAYQYAAQPAPAPSTSATASTWQTARPQGVIDIRLPDAQGEAWVDGHKVGGGGTVRTYRDVAGGNSSHIYKVTAVWHDQGRLVSQERVVDLGSGSNASVDFTQAEQTASKLSTPQ